MRSAKQLIRSLAKLSTRNLLLFILAGLVFLCLHVATGLLLIKVIREAAQTPPEPGFAYSAAVYTPERMELCPGDLLKWKPTITVTVPPTGTVVAEIVRSVWSVEQHLTVIRDLPVLHSVYTTSVVVSPPEAWEVADLPPGQYEMRVARVETGRVEKGYYTPFQIKKDCD